MPLAILQNHARLTSAAILTSSQNISHTNHNSPYKIELSDPFMQNAAKNSDTCSTPDLDSTTGRDRFPIMNALLLDSGKDMGRMMERISTILAYGSECGILSDKNNFQKKDFKENPFSSFSKGDANGKPQEKITILDNGKKLSINKKNVKSSIHNELQKLIKKQVKAQNLALNQMKTNQMKSGIQKKKTLGQKKTRTAKTRSLHKTSPEAVSFLQMVAEEEKQEVSNVDALIKTTSDDAIKGESEAKETDTKEEVKTDTKETDTQNDDEPENGDDTDPENGETDPTALRNSILARAKKADGKKTKNGDAKNGEKTEAAKNGDDTTKSSDNTTKSEKKVVDKKSFTMRGSAVKEGPPVSELISQFGGQKQASSIKEDETVSVPPPLTLSESSELVPPPLVQSPVKPPAMEKFPSSELVPPPMVQSPVNPPAMEKFPSSESTVKSSESTVKEPPQVLPQDSAEAEVPMDKVKSLEPEKKEAIENWIAEEAAAPEKNTEKLITGSEELKEMIFQLGTNNWQRPKNDGSGELEFAPGSGVLHEGHHLAYNNLPNVKSFSIYPSQNQAQPEIEEVEEVGEDDKVTKKQVHPSYRVFQLQHPIPICESASTNSSKRWHSMPEEEFSAYVQRLEDEVYEFMKECEEREQKNFTMCIAHHCFTNPLVLKRVIARRMKQDNKPQIPLYCFAHGTALKMYNWELSNVKALKEGSEMSDEVKQFPMRFHKMINEDEKLFDDVKGEGVNACFVISQQQKDKVTEIFPTFPKERIIVAPNGIDVAKFKPREKDLQQVLKEQLLEREIVWPDMKSKVISSEISDSTEATEDNTSSSSDSNSSTSSVTATFPELMKNFQRIQSEIESFKRLLVFVGKAAEWKRQPALLKAMKKIEEKYPDVALLCAGTGPEKEINKLKTICKDLKLKNTFLLGARGQNELAEMYTVADLGCFPSFSEPFGLVFVECMACKTPVIGANSGGPKDFVCPEVGELVPEPPQTTSLDTVCDGMDTISESLAEAVDRALSENWKKSKGEACLQLALDKFTVKGQVQQMLKDVKELPVMA